MGSMVNAKTLLLLLSVLISGVWEGSSETSGGLQSKSPKGKLPVVNAKTVPDTSSLLIEWNKFKNQYEIQINDSYAEIYRRNLFLENLEFINNRTRYAAFKHDSFKVAMNGMFGTEDFRNIRTGCVNEDVQKMSKWPCPIKKLSLRNQTSRAKDWRKEGRVGSVKEQGSCSSCWAFSAVAVLEGWFASKNQKLLEFSTQQLVDCPTDTPKDSCRTIRNVPYAFKILKNLNGRLATAAAYNYTALGNATCPLSRNVLLSKIEAVMNKNSIYHFKGKCARVDIGQEKESQLKEAVTRYGPVSVSIFASLPTFKFYKSGIYNDKECIGTALPTHAVTVVGFGSEGKNNYWILKNSWGTEWGEQGYMKLAMDMNLCGIANYGYFITEKDDIEGHVEPAFGNSLLYGASGVKIVSSVILSCLAFVLY